MTSWGGGYSYAAYMAKQLNSQGYLDSNAWYLPSLDETKAVVQYAVGVAVGCGRYYWSSSETSYYIYAYSVSCDDLSVSSSDYNSKKNSTNSVRLVRQFTDSVPSLTIGNPATVRGMIATGTTVNNEQAANITEVGVCYDTVTMPDINDACIKSSLNGSTFQSNIQIASLQSSQEFYLRAYAVTTDNGTFYSNQINYTNVTAVD